jgi:hypothetical protein
MIIRFRPHRLREKDNPVAAPAVFIDNVRKTYALGKASSR